MIPPLSPVQNGILSRLKHAKALRYSELIPVKVPNDLFNYHLQFLVKKEFILKSEEGYALSPKGLKHIADPYSSADPFASLFKLNVITIVSRRVGRKIEILNQLRTSNPSFGKVGVMGGVVRKGETIEAGASRKLREETGLEATFKVVGCERRMLYKKGELFSDVLFPLAYADKYTGTILKETAFGKNTWVPLKEAILNESGDVDTLPSIVTVLKALEKKTIAQLPFFFTENVQSDRTL